jgi:hypothetical protein
LSVKTSPYSTAKPGVFDLHLKAWAGWMGQLVGQVMKGLLG